MRKPFTIRIMALEPMKKHLHSMIISVPVFEPKYFYVRSLKPEPNDEIHTPV